MHMCNSCKVPCKCSCKVQKSKFFQYSGCSLYLYDYTCPQCKHTFDFKITNSKKS